MQRGEIRNRKAASRLRDFRGLCWGTISPTDIDAFIDFHGRLFVFVECKRKDVAMPIGQQLALERLVDACHAPPQRYSVGFFVYYESENEEDDIQFADTLVRKWRWNGKWKGVCERITLREAIERVLAWVEKKWKSDQDNVKDPRSSAKRDCPYP
jgi:hypothetical protein